MKTFKTYKSKLKTITLIFIGINLVFPLAVISSNFDAKCILSTSSLDYSLSQEVISQEFISQTIDCSSESFSIVDGQQGLSGIPGIENKENEGGEVTYKNLNNYKSLIDNRLIEQDETRFHVCFTFLELAGFIYSSDQLYLLNRILII